MTTTRPANRHDPKPDRAARLDHLTGACGGQCEYCAHEATARNAERYISRRRHKRPLTDAERYLAAFWPEAIDEEDR